MLTALATMGILTIITDTPIINVAISVIAFITVALFFNGELLNRLFFSLLLVISAIISEFIIAYVLSSYSDIAPHDMQFGTPEFVYGLMLSRTQFVIFVWIILSFFRNRKMPKLNVAYWVALIVPPIGGLIILYNFMFLRTHSIVDMISAVIIMVTSAIVIAIYDKILTNYEAEIKNNYLEELLQYSSYQYFLAEKSEKIISKTKHDIKNILIGFQAEIRNQNINNVQTIISQLLEEIDAFDGPAKSGNLVIDSIINYKSVIAKQSDIKFFIDLIIPKNLNVDFAGICQILGNALDNAIEATEKINDVEKRIIQITANYKQESLYIQIANPFCENIVINRNGSLMSSKRDYHTEGFGLQSIINTINKYGGSYDISYENGKFRLSVIFYNVSQVQ